MCVSRHLCQTNALTFVNSNKCVNFVKESVEIMILSYKTRHCFPKTIKKGVLEMYLLLNN